MFLETDDLKVKIRDARLQQLIDNDSTILEDASESAEATVRDYLSARYDMDEVLALTGNDRPKNVIRWVANIAIYYLYERIPDNMMPKRVENNYNETMDWLDEVSAGKKNVVLPPLPTSEDDETPKTRFKWGSQDKRTL